MGGQKIILGGHLPPPCPPLAPPLLVASCQQVVDNLSTSWEKAVRFTSCWQVVFLGVVCFCVCNGNMALLLLLLFFFFTDCHSTKLDLCIGPIYSC